MSEKEKRCQIFLDDEEYADIERIAGWRKITVEQWVHEALCKARADYHKRVEGLEKALEKASRCQFPAADIEDMLREIESGYNSL